VVCAFMAMRYHCEKKYRPTCIYYLNKAKRQKHSYKDTTSDCHREDDTVNWCCTCRRNVETVLIVLIFDGSRLYTEGTHAERKSGQ
jgi:hypothetical protein